MTIQTFAGKHRLKTRTDEFGETIVPAKRGASHVFEYGNWPGENSPNTFAVMCMSDPQAKRPPAMRQWTNRKAKMLAAGFTIVQDCDGEGTARFDPTNAAHVKLAIQVAGIRPKRVLAPEHLNRLVAASAAHRFKSATVLASASAA